MSRIPKFLKPPLRWGYWTIYRPMRAAREKVAQYTDHFLRRCAVQSRILTCLYYCVWSWAFVREQRAVLYGRVKFDRVTLRPNAGSSMLRRHVHCLEKGLLMRPRRDCFADAYILPTVECYEKLLMASDLGTKADHEELKWAHDVIAEYFRVVKPTQAIENARSVFLRLPHPHTDSLPIRAPYKHQQSGPLTMNRDALLDLIRGRASVRWFRQQPVPRDLLDSALDAARYAPSACNRQPFEFKIFDAPETISTVSKLTLGMTGYAENVPVLIAVIGRLSAYSDERDRHLIYIDASLASMCFLLALETVGLGSCCINWPDIESSERHISEFLDLDLDSRVIMLIAVGFPDPEGLVAYSQKKSLEFVREYFSK